MPLALSMVVAATILVVPGTLLGLALRLRGLWLLGLAAPLSLASIGAAGILAAWLRLPFSAWQPVVLALAAAAVVLGARRQLEGRGLWRATGADHRIERWTVAALAAASATTIVLFLVLVGDPNAISQTYDGVFHLNAVAWILDTGDASSFHLYRITHPGEDNEFYPAGWHALVALVVQLAGPALGATPIAVASNGAWIATTVIIWLPGVALLARTVAGRRHGLPVEAVAVALAAVAAPAPWMLLGWGTLYPTGLATALTPAGLAIAAELLRRRDRAAWAPLAAAGLGWLVAGVVAHPRSMLTFALLVVPLLGFRFVEWARASARQGRVRRVVVVCSALAAAAAGVLAIGWWYVYRAFDVAERPISDHLNGGPATATQSFGDALLGGLAWAVPPPDGVGDAAPQLAFAVLALAGLAIAIRSRRMRWLVVAWALVILLYAAAAGSNSDLAKILTGLWYKDKYRLLAPLATVGIPVAAIAISTFAQRIRRGARAIATAAATALAAALALLLGFTPLGAAVHRTFADSEFVSADDRALMGRLGEHMDEGAVIVGNPWDGSTLTWALGGVESLFPHLAGEWTADEELLAHHLDAAATDPAVCDAVERTGARYLYRSEGLLWGSPPEAGWFWGIDGAREDTGVLELVDREGGSTLYRISACDAGSERG